MKLIFLTLLVGTFAATAFGVDCPTEANCLKQGTWDDAPCVGNLAGGECAYVDSCSSDYFWLNNMPMCADDCPTGASYGGNGVPACNPAAGEGGGSDCQMTWTNGQQRCLTSAVNNSPVTSCSTTAWCNKNNGSSFEFCMDDCDKWGWTKNNKPKCKSAGSWIQPCSFV